MVSQTSAAPLVLQIPSPMRWLALTHELSGAGTMSDLTSDDAENAAMHVAGWLRRLSQLEVSMLILDASFFDLSDRSGTGPGSCRALSLGTWRCSSGVVAMAM